MRAARLCVVLPPLLAAGVSAASAPERVIDLRPSQSDWLSSVQGPYECRADLRELWQISHPWVVSAAGNFGQVSTSITIPEDWQPPVKLRLYESDNYEGGSVEDRTYIDWFYDTFFNGHRSKQVLVDGEVVWEADVADPGVRDSPCHRSGRSGRAGADL